ncbi:MAG: GFA family protein [Candidatus Binataceae bacterium]
MARQAQCSCGQLRVLCEGVPAKVSICHCNDCRRRTGSAFGIAAFFDRTRITIEGKAKLFTRLADNGHKVDFHFCPICGSTVFWEPARKPDMIGVAVGAFADPLFPVPHQSVWDNKRHSWITFPDEIQTRPSG